MSVSRINDWKLEDERADAQSPILVLFVDSHLKNGGEASREFRLLSKAYPDTRFFEIDLVENPSLKEKMSITRAPAVAAFLGGVHEVLHVGAGMTRSVRMFLQKALGPDSRSASESENGGSP